MRSTYKLLCLTACAALLVSLSTFGLTGCRSNDIPTSTPSMPESSSSVPEPSSSSAPSSSESSSSVSSEAPSSSSKPASTGGNSGGSGSSAKTYSKAVIDSKKETLKTVKITASDVILSNKTITGDLIIDKGVAKGKVSLNNVKVGKTIYVYGGGENSVYLDDVTAGKLISASTVSRPRIVAKGDTNIGKTEIRYDTLLEYDGLSYSAKGFNQIETVKTSQFLTVLKLYDVGVYSMILSDDTNLFLLGNSSVSYLTANAPAYIEGGEKVGTLECNNKDVAIDTAPAYITSKNGTGYYTPEILDGQDNEDDEDDDDDDRTFAAPRLSWKNSGTVTWSSVSGAVHGYEVRINQKGSSLYYAQSFGQNDSRQLNIEDVLDSKGAVSGNYQVRVKVYSTASVDESPFSNVLSYSYTGTGTALALSNLAFNYSDRSKCTLSWAAAGAASYDIVIATDDSFRNKVKSYSITDPNLKSSDLRAAMGTVFTAGNYWVKVTARTLFDKKEATIPLAVTAATTPADLRYDEGTKKVTWGDSAAASYEVSVNGTIKTISGLELDLNDTAYPIGATYNITVKRLGSAGNQVDSDPVPLTVTKPGPTALAAPTNVVLSRINSNQLVLSWNAVPNAQDYTVSLKKDGTEVQNLVVTGATTCTFTTYTAQEGTYTTTVKASASGYTDSMVVPTGTPLTLTTADLYFDAGNGTSASPYQVKTDAQFAQIGGNSITAGTYFTQTADFTITSPISNFKGNYDGKGKQITISINASGTQDVGLFGAVASGAMVTGINVGGSSLVVGSSNVGMIAGTNNGTIQGCTVGTASAVKGTANVGGISGLNNATGTVQGCTYSGGLRTTDSDINITIAHPTFGLICGINQAIGSSVSENNITEAANNAAIGAIGSPPEGFTEDTGGADALMAARLLPWLGL